MPGITVKPPTITKKVIVGIPLRAPLPSVIPEITISPTPPPNPTIGDLWLDTSET